MAFNSLTQEVEPTPWVPTVLLQPKILHDFCTDTVSNVSATAVVFSHVGVIPKSVMRRSGLNYA